MLKTRESSLSWRLRPSHTTHSAPFGVQIGDSLAFLGMRRTGKTTLSTAIYKDMMDSDQEMVGYIIDSNRGGDFTGWSGGYFGPRCPIIYPGPKGRQVVWQPEYDNFDMYEDFFGRLFESVQREGFPVVVLADELSAFGGGDNHPQYSRILKRGRRRSNFAGITMISLSQEMAQKAKVPRQTFTQMVHFFKFLVQHPYDLAEANRKLGLPLHIQPEHQHGFWHANMDMPPIKPTYYKGMEVVIK